jgi:hypothetical protein
MKRSLLVKIKRVRPVPYPHIRIDFFYQLLNGAEFFFPVFGQYANGSLPALRIGITNLPEVFVAGTCHGELDLVNIFERNAFFSFLAGQVHVFRVKFHCLCSVYAAKEKAHEEKRDSFFQQGTRFKESVCYFAVKGPEKNKPDQKKNKTDPPEVTGDRLSWEQIISRLDSGVWRSFIFIHRMHGAAL